MTTDPVAELVRRTRRAQGLPERVADPTTLAQLAQLIEPALPARAA